MSTIYPMYMTVLNEIKVQGKIQINNINNIVNMYTKTPLKKYFILQVE